MMTLYNQFKDTPKEVQKTIKGGRLNGFTDINPMWRIKRLTEVFGPCGIGWWVDIINKWTETGANNEICAFVELKLYIDYNGKVSHGIEGIGGSSLVAKERNGLYTSDECFKMAFTDALGSACKLLGMSADIFYQNDRSKYNSTSGTIEDIKCSKCGNVIKNVKKDGKIVPAAEVARNCGGMCVKCYKKAKCNSKELRYSGI